VSDHLCWSQARSGSTHDLLPMPQTHESLRRVVENLEIVQNYLARTILLENISYYFNFKNNDFDEADFINEVCTRSGCDLLLDVNNIYVNSVNHGFDPKSFLERLPVSKIKQIHLAGPTQEEGYLFDTHSTTVPDQVWNLYWGIKRKLVNIPVIVEWDQDIPSFDTLEQEIEKIRLYTEKWHEEPIPSAT